MADLIQWPDTARVGQTIAKERLYAETSAGAALKKRFIDEVQRVRWAYKLGEESLRLAAGETVTEVQVFVVDLKGSSLDKSVLAAIDGSIPSHIVFELRRGNGLWTEQAMTATYNRSGRKAKGNDYYRTGWVGTDQPRLPLPAALDMDGLYSRLLSRLLPHPIRPGEQLPDALERMGRIGGLTREIAALEKRLRVEPQLNRKFHVRRQLEARTAVLKELTDPAPTSKG
ncbi:DUF4391 domain-containing protein [uncultured Pseudokineococcus sp.]|uniref:DUF4391 domain-containing protein n=1 Tax=uncultured Pseudokineococcus sp. TaxID=1642928 RepID=UPI00261AFAFB|nr:DUF4391 domain-containing protein [uncultured Pseudokineococcus sp.]